ncbi:MAG: HmuY family protein [Breznakibacter sp.]
MKKTIFSLAMVAAISFTACNDDDPKLPDNLVNFATDAVGIDDDEQSKAIQVILSRNVDSDTKVTLSFTESGVTYGSEYTTEPAAEDQTITLTVVAGSNTASFNIIKNNDAFFSGSEQLVFNVTDAESPLILGSSTVTTVSFASIVSEGSSMTLQGGEGGASAVNSVFVDFSNNAQSSVLRQSWDLGFYCGDDFKVILNHTVGASAIALEKTDLSLVSATDTIGLNLTVATSNANAFNIIDDVDGDMSQTVFGTIPESDAKVYIINRGTAGSVAARAWKKVRVLRTASGYTLQYANITDATYQTLQITKDDAYNFQFVSFDGGLVTFQPAKAKWDIMWTGAMYKTLSSGTYVPYYFSDQVLINNLAGVTAAEVLVSDDVTYSTYAETHIATTTFSDARSTIGSNWRATTGTVGVKTDRFYVVKDFAGNVYKLRFINFHASDGGTRGYPNIEYALVKKAE